MPTLRFVPVLLALCATALLGLSACAGLRAQTSSGAAASGKECKACERMCEVAGDAQANPGAITQCKADCQKKCG